METFDDIKGTLIPGAFKKTCKNITKAFKDDAFDKSLMKTAVKRGVSMKVLEDTAKNITFIARCARSIYHKPPVHKEREANSKEIFDFKRI